MTRREENLPTYLHPHFTSLRGSNLNVRDVEGLLGLPGHGSLAGDHLAVGGGQVVQKSRGTAGHGEIDLLMEM